MERQSVWRQSDSPWKKYKRWCPLQDTRTDIWLAELGINGTTSGTSGLGKRLEAIQIELTGQAAQQYDIYYRVHVQSYGWLDWAKNGQMSGTSGLAKRLEESRLCSYRRELRHRERQREPASTGRIEGGLLYD